MDKTVDHYEVPTDFERHEFQLTYPPKILLTGCRENGLVEFWAVNQVGARTQRVQLIAYLTGAPIPEWSDYRGSAIAPNGDEWHLFEEFDEEESAGRRSATEAQPAASVLDGRN